MTDPRDAHIRDLRVQLGAANAQIHRLTAMLANQHVTAPVPAVVATTPTVRDADAEWVEKHPDDGMGDGDEDS